MDDKNRTLADEQLTQELRKNSGGKLGGKILAFLGVAIAVIGIILGGNLILILIGVVILGLGQMPQGKSKNKASQQAFDTLVPDIVNTVFDNVQIDPTPHLLKAEETNIPLPAHDYCNGNGYIQGIYHGLTTELCTIKLTDTTEFQREETGLWEKNEREIYTGQWMLCKLDHEFPTWLTIWPKERLDKLCSSKTIKTGNEIFDKRFNLSSDNETATLHILTNGCLEQIIALADTSFGKFSINLNADGRLYLAVHSGRSFFDLGKARETPVQLRQRFSRELTWFTDMIDVFRNM